MAKSKLFNEIYNNDSFYDIEQAIEIVKKASSAKFDESVDLAISLNVDPRHAEENIRLSTSLPKGTGKKVVLLVLAQGEKVQEALASTASSVMWRAPPGSLLIRWSMGVCPSRRWPRPSRFATSIRSPASLASWRRLALKARAIPCSWIVVRLQMRGFGLMAGK
jgi:hypothetical protein